MRRSVLAIALACALVGACTGAQPAPVSPAAERTADEAGATATARPTPTSAAEPAIGPSGGFSTTIVTLRPPDGEPRGAVQVDAWVADSPALRARGLMDREELEAGTGMVFEHDRDSTARFWMRDTLAPLSIAFANADGTIIDILDMDPCASSPCPRYGPDAPYRRALEVPQGWFDEVGVEAGWLLE